MTMFAIHPLADAPQHVEACAAWAYGRWGVQKPHGSLSRALGKFRESMQKGALPLTLVATRKDLPIGMGSLWPQDGTHWPQYTPWIAGVFTLYRYRGQGVARAIIARLEDEARALTFEAAYLQSGSAAGYYVGLGYEALETIPTDETAAGTLTVFRKTLTKEEIA